jgi:phytoene dehydrogenase-like protein
MSGNDVVVGGGLAGLSAALRLARSGRRVVLVERSHAVGGRSVTRDVGGFLFNLGPHAVYPDAAAVLAELGIGFRGALPPARGHALDGGRLHTLPAGFLSLLTTGLLGLPEKLEVARLLASLPRLDASRFDGTTVRAWSESALSGARARRFAEALLRIVSYTEAPTRLSAGYALAQLQSVFAANVRYLDGGWQTLVDGLRDAAEVAGVRIVAGSGAEGIDHRDGQVRAVRLRGGDSIPAASVILATGPDVAARLTGEHTLLARFAAGATPVRAASLEVALSSLPRPERSAAFGIDRPLYFSVHSAVATLAPPGGALLHVAAYLDPDLPLDADGARAELEALVDRLQPGWRERLVDVRWLPSLTVAHALPTASQQGVGARFETRVAELPGVYLAGDWVGREGHLAGAALASARSAVDALRADAGARTGTGAEATAA